MSRGPDAATLLQRALDHSARAAGVAVTVTAADATRWASATFTGARHCLTLQARDDTALAAWLGELPEADLPLRGHLVADIAIVAVARAGAGATIGLEALTVET